MTSLEDMRGHCQARRGQSVRVPDPGRRRPADRTGGRRRPEPDHPDQEHAQLAEPVRFTAGWEGEAIAAAARRRSAVLTEYDQHGRIRGGGTLIRSWTRPASAYLAGYLQGGTCCSWRRAKTCRELSQRIREDLQHLGLVERGAEARLREGAKASVGDLIVTRKNDHRLGVANGDTGASRLSTAKPSRCGSCSTPTGKPAPGGSRNGQSCTRRRERFR